MLRRETVFVAIDALRANKLRAFLTMLGVVIGSACIVLVVTVSLTGRQFITLVCEAAGQPVRTSVINKPMMMLAGIFDPQIREAIEVYYQFAQPFVMDASKFTQAFGSRITPHSDAIKATVDARRKRISESRGAAKASA